MKIINKTSGERISENASLKTTSFERFFGLMFSKKKKDIVLVSSREGILDSSIHMLFMRYLIDVLWLDSDRKVVDFQKNVKPFNFFNPKTWKIYKPKKPAKYIIELGKNELGDIKLGDTIEFVD